MKQMAKVLAKNREPLDRFGKLKVVSKSNHYARGKIV